jgi:hypothetical protein
MAEAMLDRTNSRSIQKKTNIRLPGIPSLAPRDNTHRPVAVTQRKNVVAGRKPGANLAEVGKILDDARLRGAKLLGSGSSSFRRRASALLRSSRLSG